MLFRLAGDKVLAKPTLKRAWTQEEDAILIEAVKREGAHNWTVIARAFNGSRKDKQCRERWFNHRARTPISRGHLCASHFLAW